MEEEVHPSYLAGHEDVEGLPYPISSLGPDGACAPIPCPGGVEIVLVGEGIPRVGAFAEETNVLSSFSRLGLIEENRQDMRGNLPMEPDDITHDIMERQEQDRLIPSLSSPKFTLPPPDIRTVHHMNPPTYTSPWGFQTPETQGEDSGVAGVSSEGQYIQDRRYEWALGLDEAEANSRLMTVRSIPPPISMPVFRRALQLGREQVAWQGGNYSEEEAQVEVEEEEEEEEEGSVYTCIECSIYFKKKAHLLEHMFQHSQENEGEGSQTRDGPHTCGECGKGFVDEGSLVSHRRQHQESRQKIIEEIRKLENLEDEGRGARLQCPKCLFGTNSSKVFVQHAKTHVRKGPGDGRGATTSFQDTLEMSESGGASEQSNDRIWNSPQTEAGSEQGWVVEIPQDTQNKGAKSKRKTPPREGSGRYLQTDSRKEVGTNASVRDPRIPQAAVELKWRFRDALKASGGEEEGKRRQLRAEVAIVVLENIAPKKQRPKGPQALSYERRICRGEDGAEHSLPSGTSALELELPQEEWGESGIPLDILLMDPNYEGQLEALGLRSEERECPYCPDRFHNGIGLANHVRGHLNRVGVSYNVRHFISAEEVKAIEQNYSFQKKRKKVANFDPSTFSLMRCEFCGAGFDTRAGLSSHARAHLRDFGITNWELTVSPIHVLARLLARSPGRPLPPFPTWHQDADTDAIGSEEEDETPLDLWHSQIPKQESGRVVEKMASDQNAGRSEDQKGPGQTTCEVCGACFETRKGLSSHARSHLRHLGVAGSESSGAPIDLLYELAKQGKLPQEESFLGAKKAGSPLPGSPRGQWGDEDGPLNLTMDAEPGRDTDCQFCGAWFETRKGLSSHARAHLRHLGVTDPDAKGSPIAALNALIKSEDFKKRLSAGHVSVEADTHIKTSENSTSTNSGMSISQHRDLSAHSKLTEAGTFSRMADGTVKAGDGASAKMTDGNMLAVHSDGSVRSFDSGMSAETAIHFKCPSTGGTNAHVKHGESSTPRALTPVISSHPKMDKGGNAHVKSETGSSHNKMLKVGSHPKASPTGLAHPRPSPTGTPSVKKLKTSKASMDSYWSSSNSSTPLNLSPGSEEVRCEFCGEFFENRKGLSSHARSHLRQMGVTEWHVNGSPIDTLREILASGTCPRPGTRVGGPSSEKLLPLSPSPSGSAAYSGLAPGLQHKPHRLHSYPAGEWPSDLSPLNLSSRADPTRDIRCEFCNEFFENRKGLSSHARSHLRQMGVTEWHVNGSPIDTLREIIRKRRPPPPHLPNIKKEPRGDRNPTSPSPSPTHSPLSMGPPGLAREIPISPLGGRPHNFMSPLSPKRPASHEPRMSHSEPKNYIHLEPKSCNQSQAKSYMQGDSRPKSFMQEEGRSKSYMQGDGRPKPYMQGDGRPKPYAQGEGKPKGYLQGEGKPKGYLQGEGKPKGYLQGEGKPKGYLQGEGKPKGYLQGEGKPKGYLQGEGKPKGYLQGEGKPKGYLQGEGKPKGYLQGEGKPKGYLQGEGKPKGYLQGEGKPRGYLQGEGKPRGYLQGEGKPRGYLQGEGKPRSYLQGEGKPRSYLQGEGKPRSYLQGEGKPKGYLQGEGKPKGYPQGEGKLKGYPQGDGKPKAYIQTELPFKVKVKASPDKAATTLEACCELCGLYFENRKALASHARAHLRQFGVTEWCVNGSPIETLREWMKQRPQKAGAYLSYIQGGRPFTKKFKRSSQPPKAAVSTEKESQVPVPNKVAEMDWTSGTPGTLTEKPTEGQGQKTERRYSKPTEFPPTREDGIAEPTPKSEEQRPPIRARPVPSLVPRPPQTSLVKFVGNIYTLKCRFCDIQFQGPLSIQEQWVRHLQHHILEMNFSKSPSPPPVLPPPAHPEPAKAV